MLESLFNDKTDSSLIKKRLQHSFLSVNFSFYITTSDDCFCIKLNRNIGTNLIKTNSYVSSHNISSYTSSNLQNKYQQQEDEELKNINELMNQLLTKLK